MPKRKKHLHKCLKSGEVGIALETHPMPQKGASTSSPVENGCRGSPLIKKLSKTDSAGVGPESRRTYK